MVEVKRKPKESIENLLRRFAQLLEEDGKLERAKKIRFREKPKSRERLKREALLRKAYEDKMRYLRKIGKIK